MKKDYIYLNLLNPPNQAWYKLKAFLFDLLFVFIF